MKALYYPDDCVWKVEKDGNLLAEYELTEVPIDLVDYFAIKDGKIGKDETIGDPEFMGDLKEILKWFENDIFPSERFGKILIKYQKRLKDDDVEVLSNLKSKLMKKPGIKNLNIKKIESYFIKMGDSIDYVYSRIKEGDKKYTSEIPSSATDSEVEKGYYFAKRSLYRISPYHRDLISEN